MSPCGGVVVVVVAVVVDQEEPSDETPELEGDTDPSTRATCTDEFGDTDDVDLSPEKVF